MKLKFINMALATMALCFMVSAVPSRAVSGDPNDPIILEVCGSDLDSARDVLNMLAINLVFFNNFPEECPFEALCYDDGGALTLSVGFGDRIYDSFTPRAPSGDSSRIVVVVLGRDSFEVRERHRWNLFSSPVALARTCFEEWNYWLDDIHHLGENDRLIFCILEKDLTFLKGAKSAILKQWGKFNPVVLQLDPALSQLYPFQPCPYNGTINDDPGFSKFSGEIAKIARNLQKRSLKAVSVPEREGSGEVPLPVSVGSNGIENGSILSSTPRGLFSNIFHSIKEFLKRK
ncbi:MAG: hypothetical protein LBP36_03100 [Oscillospiraceae bacterium]|jgi:hypothetical protein|nr:hypothetical protein [Oscillospiraceae bacterium]